MIQRWLDHRRLLTKLAVGSLAASATLASGCADRRDAPPARAARLAIGYADPRPQASRQRGIDAIVTNLSGERLVGLAPDGRPEPTIAERWETSPDGLSWRFTLRPDLTLHDGSPLDASVAGLSLERQIAGAKDPGTLAPGLRTVTAIEPVGKHELVVRLSRPNALLLESMNLAPPQGGKDNAQAAGPFRLVSRDQSGVVLSAFPGYHRGRPPLERIEIREFPSARNAWSAMMRDEIDFLYDVPPEALDFVEQSSTTRVATFLRAFVTALVFNEAHPVLRRREVRVALNRAVDRDAVIKLALRGRGRPAFTHLWPRHWAYNPAQPDFAFDAAGAAAMLDTQGLRVSRNADRQSRFAFTCLVPADTPRFEQVAVHVQQQLAQIGVDMRLEAVPVPVLQQRMQAGNYDAFLFELGSHFGVQWLYWFWHSSPGPPWMTTRYKAADAALEALRDARSDEETRAGVHALQRVMHEDPPAVFLYWMETTRAVSRRFAVPDTPDRDILATVSQWRLAEPGSE